MAPAKRRKRSNSEPYRRKLGIRDVKLEDSDKKSVGTIARTDHGIVVIKNDVIKLVEEKMKDSVFRKPELPNPLKRVATTVLSTSLPFKHPAIPSFIDQNITAPSFKESTIWHKPTPPVNPNVRLHNQLLELLYGHDTPSLPDMVSLASPQFPFRPNGS